MVSNRKSLQRQKCHFSALTKTVKRNNVNVFNILHCRIFNITEIAHVNPSYICNESVANFNMIELHRNPKTFFMVC